MLRQTWRLGLPAVMLVGALASGAVGEVTTEQSASILVFPKVIADGTRDTVIQITNTNNSMVHAHCFYVNGALTSADQPAGPGNPPLCTEIDFDIWLTRQQPTYWVVSEGRQVDPEDAACTRQDLSCPNAGLDPGRVPPVVPDFTGELKCIEVDASGAPLSGNHLKGEATLVTNDVCVIPDGETVGSCLLSGEECTVLGLCGPRQDIAKYNGIGIPGDADANDGDGTLCLGGTATADCPVAPGTGEPEYGGCPQTWIMNHLAEGAPSPFQKAAGAFGAALDTSTGVHTDVTVVPCTENFETQVPATVTLQFLITNEYEQAFSASTSVSCWAEENLAAINPVFLRSAAGSDLLQTRVRPSSGNPGGFLIVLDERHVNVNGEAATAAANAHWQGEVPGPDVITIPSDQLE